MLYWPKPKAAISASDPPLHSQRLPPGPRSRSTNRRIATPPAAISSSSSKGTGTGTSIKIDTGSGAAPQEPVRRPHAPLAAPASPGVLRTSAPRTSQQPPAKDLGATAHPSKQAARSGKDSKDESNAAAEQQHRAFMDLLSAGFGCEAREEWRGVWLQVTEGALPPELVGSFFRNGPACFPTPQPDSSGRGGNPREGSSSAAAPGASCHPLDCGGLVAVVHLRGDGSALYRAARVRTCEQDA
ncbi:hypothetical protein Agub_g3195, partial [Astrephomene gubernaculifera]